VSIQEFNLNVSGSGHSASVTGAGGYFYETPHSSHFSLYGGEATIDTTSSATFGASGSFYGPTAQSMGGVWSIAGEESSNAVGIFHGDKQGTTNAPPEVPSEPS
jgi:hypothetical protein